MDIRIAIAAFEAVDDGNASVSDVCQQLGISRDTFYRYRGRLEAEGFPGLLPRSTRPRSSPGQTPAEMVELIVEKRGGPGEGWLGLWRPVYPLPPQARRDRCPLRQDGSSCSGAGWSRRAAAGQAAAVLIQTVRAPGPQCLLAAGRDRVGAGGPERGLHPAADRRPRPDDSGQPGRAGGEHTRGVGVGRNRASPTRASGDAAQRRGLSIHLSPNHRRHQCLRAEAARPGHQPRRVLTAAPTNVRQEGTRLAAAEAVANAHPPATTLAELQNLLDAYDVLFNTDRPHQGINGATPAERYAASAKAVPAPGPLAPPVSHSQRQVRASGRVDLGNRFSVCLGHEWTGATVTVVRDDLDVAILHEGQLIKRLTIDTSRKSQASGLKRGRHLKR